MNSKKHIYYIDYLRIFASFGVVLMHSSSNPLRVLDSTRFFGSWQVLNILISLSFCAVPLFFMMSGYLLMTSSKTADINLLLKSRLPRLIAPLAFATLLGIIWSACTNYEITLTVALQNVLKAIGTPNMVHFWFMYTLIPIYMISPILYGGIHSLSHSGKHYLFTLVRVVVAIPTISALLPTEIQTYFQLDYITALRFFNGHFCSFLLGYFIGSLEKKVPNWLILTVGLLDFIFIILVTFFLTARNGEYTATAQTQSLGFEIILASCIFLFAKQNLNKTTPSLQAIVTPLAAFTFPIYLMHNKLNSILFSYGWTVESTQKALLTTLVSYVGCYILAKLFSSWKATCYMATGLTYSEACKRCNLTYTKNKLLGRKRR